MNNLWRPAEERGSALPLHNVHQHYSKYKQDDVIQVLRTFGELTKAREQAQ